MTATGYADGDPEKSDVGHGHAQADVTGLIAALTAEAAARVAGDSTSAGLVTAEAAARTTADLAEVTARNAAIAAAIVTAFTDAIATASTVDSVALTARAKPGATPPNGNVFQALDNADAVLVGITRFSANFNVTPAFYQAVLTGTKIYAGAGDPDAGAPDGSVWFDTTTQVMKTRVAGAWYSPLVPGAWLSPVFATGAGNPEALAPATVANPAGRVESPLAGTVRLRGGISALAAGAGIAQSVTIATLPAALRPSTIRQVSIRTRGVTSTHSTLTIATNGDMALQTTALAAGSTLFLDGITYSL
jgi:hypothetical protein